ncbi:SRPBCC family protein [Kitasatospora sp. NPDC089509]|uniref:SRPBCC family protein n=1 Tax=Kitasatospora sp. NPDC089509 TaxID=3364079 RepID=UPI00381278D4
MPTSPRNSVHSVTVDAPPEAVFDLVADTDQHRRIFGSVIHTAREQQSESRDRVERWSWDRASDSVRSWQASRELDRAAGRIAFTHENPPVGLGAVSGEWVFRTNGAGATEVELRHEFSPVSGAGDEVAAQLDRGVTAQLEQLRTFVESRADRDELEVSYEAQLLIDEPVEDIYGYFHDADRWNERIPHCLSASAKQDADGVQIVVMDVQVPSGALHTTKQARVCYPDEKIVWRQLEGLPPLDDMLYGYMLFEQTPEGVLVRTGQTELLKRTGVAKRGWSVEEAKEHVAEVRGGRNLDSLRSAQEYLSRRRA